ncbi:MAG: hypothetical protein EP298_08840 [Gammaproteobacteria bacterium]|nr:MAG: hypothetical protein EP298_08840 [Gammaproteobacteria bacterium]UTW43143.1 hypothetical protein KFE69_03080 [bacterium SCSIO 12844]
MRYQYEDKVFYSQVAIFKYLKSISIVSCGYNFFINALKKNNRNVLNTIKYTKKHNHGRAKVSQGFEVDGAYFNNMSEFEDKYNLPKNTVSNIKSKQKLSVQEAALKALELPIAKHQVLYKNKMISKFLQSKLPTTNLAYRYNRG